MKNLISILLVLTMVLSLPVSCIADSTVDIEPLGFAVSLPSELVYFTQDTDTSSSIWMLFGEDYDPTATIEYLKSNNIYLDAFPYDLAYEITLIVSDDFIFKGISDLTLFDDYQLDSFVFGLKKTTKDVTIKNDYFYESGGIKYYTFDGAAPSDDQAVYLKSYITVVNGMSLIFRLHSYDAPVNKQQEEAIKKIVDSVHFKETESKPAEPTQENPAEPTQEKQTYTSFAEATANAFKESEKESDDVNDSDIEWGMSLEQVRQIEHERGYYFVDVALDDIHTIAYAYNPDSELEKVILSFAKTYIFNTDKLVASIDEYEMETAYYTERLFGGISYDWGKPTKLDRKSMQKLIDAFALVYGYDTIDPESYGIGLSDEELRNDLGIGTGENSWKLKDGTISAIFLYDELTLSVYKISPSGIN